MRNRVVDLISVIFFLGKNKSENNAVPEKHYRTPSGNILFDMQVFFMIDYQFDYP